VLRSVHRGLDEGIVNDQCVLAPQYYHVDRLWYTRDEAAEFLPAELRPGARKSVTGPVLDGMVRLYLMASGGGSHFDEKHLKERSLTSEVTAVTGPMVKLRLSGRVRSEANEQFIQKKYQGELLGYATYDSVKRAYTRFDLIALGKHNIVDPRDLLTGAAPEMTLGIVFTLNPTDWNNQRMPTKFGLYRYVGLRTGE
jgi:hypothetical protein